MRSRATSTDRPPDWRTWIVGDLVRYWYAVGVLAVLVLGVGELARIGTPLDGAELAALLLLSIAVVFAGVAGYALLWRRDGEFAQSLRRGGRFLTVSLRRLLRRTPVVVPPTASPPQDDDRERADGGDREEHEGGGKAL